MIYIFSAPRSGSTWLGKIFDSHPDVLYLHEPEIADRGMDLLPFWADSAHTAEEIKGARRYLDRMLRARSPRAAGTRPFFVKRYRSGLAEYMRRAIVYAAKGAERIGGERLANRLYIPDLAHRGSTFTTVIKSVSALGRAERLIEAAGPAMRPVLLIRHPCGYANSMLRGGEIGVMKRVPPLGRLLHTRSAKRLGAEEANLEAADEIEQLTWSWLLSNAEAYSAIVAAGGAIVIYETLAGDALGGISALFQQVGLDLRPETEAFLRRAGSGDGGYYSVFQDPAKAISRWRKDLSQDTIDRIKAIVMRDPLGQLFFA